ncbi:MAG: HD domain-containing protein [Clostridia bacterium]|nr:HD domain-containing protein [Clostridia bacterium]
MEYSESLIERVRGEISFFLSGKRLAHTFAVEEECLALGTLFSAHPTLFSEEETAKLRVAALLHDITKQKTLEEQEELCRRYGIPLTDYERMSPKVLHAKTAPDLANEHLLARFGERIVDDAIADAIRTHTTAAPCMSMMGKLLYLADYIEPTRTFPDCVTLRGRFYEKLDGVSADPERLSGHLDAVILESLDMTIRDLMEQEACIDPQTVAARNALLFARRAAQNRKG